MELRHLRYFIAVAEELNFTKAAEKLHLAQPSLTRQIHNLEEELSVQLLDRTKNPVILTEEGTSFLVDARRIISQSLECMAAVQRLSRGESAQLNLGYLFKFNYDLLPATMVEFRRICPNIAVNLFDMQPSEQLRALETRKIDLGFVGLQPPNAAKSMAALDWECVAHHKVVVVMPENHPLVKHAEIKMQDLKSEFFVTMSEESHPGSRDWLSAQCLQAGFIPRILQDVELESGLMTFVAEGLGVTLAREQIKKLLHPGAVFRPLSSSVKADYWIAWHRENRSKALQEYIRIVKENADVSSDSLPMPPLHTKFRTAGFPMPRLAATQGVS